MPVIFLASAEFWSDQFVNGMTTGSIYALIALGYTMVYGVLQLINFAHGEVFMIGAFAGYAGELIAETGIDEQHFASAAHDHAVQAELHAVFGVDGSARGEVRVGGETVARRDPRAPRLI